MPKPKRSTKFSPARLAKLNKALAAKWEKRLAKDGLQPLGSATHWTFPGSSNWHGVGFTSLSQSAPNSITAPADLVEDGQGFERLSSAAFSVEDGTPVTAADTWIGKWFRRFSQDVAALPSDWPRLNILRSFADTGYITRTAKACKVSRELASEVIDLACKRFGYDSPGKYKLRQRGTKPPSPYCTTCAPNGMGKHSKHGAAKTLTKREREALNHARASQYPSGPTRRP